MIYLLLILCAPYAASQTHRIVVLAPDIARNLIDLGAEDSIVGIVKNDELEAKIPWARVVGDHQQLSIEAIFALNPDYVIVWQGGNPEPQIQKMRTLGLNIVRIRTTRLADLPAQWRTLGQLLGKEQRAEQLGLEFMAQLQRLEATQEKPVRLFYQLWHQPLMSVSNTSWLSEVFTLCGAENVMADAAGSFPQIGIEAVLAADVEVIIASDELSSDWKDRWRKWPQVPAVSQNHLYTVRADYLHQLTGETLKGVLQVCEAVARAR